jgi:hypothetical protein
VGVRIFFLPKKLSITRSIGDGFALPTTAPSRAFACKFNYQVEGITASNSWSRELRFETVSFSSMYKPPQKIHEFTSDLAVAMAIA